jgi:hypothetical protein
VELGAGLMALGVGVEIYRKGGNLWIGGKRCVHEFENEAYFQTRRNAILNATSVSKFDTQIVLSFKLKL